MTNEILSPHPSQVSILDELVDKLGHDGRYSETRQAVGPLIDRLEQSVDEPERSVIMPRHELMLALVSTIKDLVFDEQAADAPAAPEAHRERIVDLMARIVQDLTDADCVLVRRLHTDGRAELTGLPYFHGKPLGRPPRVKTLRDGVSSRILFARPDRKPTVVPDVEAPDADPDLRAAHRANLENWPHDSPEYQFISAIRAEICIPLVVKGTALAGVVAIRWQPYGLARARQIEQVLSCWQKILTYFYNYALPIEEYNRTHARIVAITRSIPQVVASITDAEFLGKVATLLTCDQGLAWHRAFIYLFQDPYPSDAVCLMALGGAGEPRWSDKQAELSARYSSLAEYLSHAESSEFGLDDPLYLLARDQAATLTLPRSRFVQHEAINRVFSGEPDPNSGFPRGDEVVVLSARDPWLDGLPAINAAFTGAAAACERSLIPLIRQQPYEPLGFLILDTPYARVIEACPDLALTQLVAHLLASLLAERGLGIEGWREGYEGRLTDLRSAQVLMARFREDRALRSKFEEKARSHAPLRSGVGQG